ncbi:MAG: hypothetical protein AAB263_22570, partial [Planctomycetota bacterium]
QDESFYHDFDVGAKVIATLQTDLERLRGITKQQAEEGAKPKLLEADLAMLEQLKSGSLSAVDVAAPVAGLIEALDGARAEAEAFEEQVAAATGASNQQTLTELPDAQGDAAAVLAGATTVVRELAASLARNQKRITALKSMADESDEARHSTEEELEQTRAALESVCATLQQRAVAGNLTSAPALADQNAQPEARATAAGEVVERLLASSQVQAAAIEQLELTDRLVKGAAKTTKAATGPTKDAQTSVADRLRKAGQELERYTLDLEKQLEASRVRERELAKQIREMSVAVSASAPTATNSEDLLGLDQALSAAAAAPEEQNLGEATRRVVAGIKANAGKAEKEARVKVVKRVATELVKACTGDSELAPMAADIALALEDDRPAEATKLEANVHQMVIKLSARKQSVEAERARLAGELQSLRTEHKELVTRTDSTEAARGAEVTRLSGELQRMNAQLNQAKAEVEDQQARVQDKSSSFSKQVTELRRELNELRTQHQEQHAAVARLNQELEAMQAKTRQQREELTGRLAERDNLITAKDRTIEQLSNQRIDGKALDIKVQVLSQELNAALDRVKQLESEHGERAGQLSKNSDLAEVHQQVSQERDDLRAQKRALESELSDANANAQKLVTELAELRKEDEVEAKHHARELAEEREKNQAIREEFRKLKEEVAGLKARLRKLTEG